MVNKGKYWILEKNKGVPVSFWKILKGFFQIEYSNFEGYKGIDKGNQYSISKEIEKILSTFVLLFRVFESTGHEGSWRNFVVNHFRKMILIITWNVWYLIQLIMFLF